MSLHTVPARWFEVLTLPELIPTVVEALARSGSVELEAPESDSRHMSLPDLQERMQEFQELAGRYQEFWPEPYFRREGAEPSVMDTLDTALASLRGWAEQAGPRVREIEALRREETDLGLLQEFLGTLGMDSAMDLGSVAEAGPSLTGALFVVSPDAELPPAARNLLIRRSRTANHVFLLTLGPPGAIRGLGEALGGRQARRIEIPDWLTGRPPEAMGQLTDRRSELEAREAEAEEAIRTLNAQHGVAGALGEVRRLEWLVGHLPRVPVSSHFAWVHGWTDDWEGEVLPEALADLPALIHFPAPPPDKEAPLLLRNPPWVRPFELFARLIGMPGRGEADPSLTLAIVTPLLFGYMFGDLGQGLVLAGIGWFLRHRVPVLRLLIPGGLAAALFGVLFGSVFSLENVIPALWLHPLAHPMPVLAIPLGFGAFLLLLSMLLEGLQSAWLGRLGFWAQARAGMAVLYVGLLTAWWLEPGRWLAIAGGAWFLAGEAWHNRSRRWLALAIAVGELAEEGLRLLVNTLSFARVGAFTLAHGGLSQAVTSLAAGAGGGLLGALILVLGNVVIIALEGLVVSVQTTRLVLFEFFLRFLHGGGRAFQPISPPAARALATGQGEPHASTAH